MEDDSELAIFEPWVILPAQVVAGGAPWASNTKTALGRRRVSDRREALGLACAGASGADADGHPCASRAPHGLHNAL